MSAKSDWIGMSDAIHWIEQKLGKGKALDPLLWRAGEEAISVRSKRVQVYGSDGRGVDLKGRGASGIAALTVGLATAHIVMFGGGGENRLKGTTIDRLVGDDLAYTAHMHDGSNAMTFTFMGVEFRSEEVADLFDLTGLVAPQRMTDTELRT